MVYALGMNHPSSLCSLTNQNDTPRTTFGPVHSYMYHPNVFQAKQRRSGLNPESRVCLDRSKANAKVTSVRKWIQF